jgi:hypothetical protein
MIFIFVAASLATASEDSNLPKTGDSLHSWCGKYPISFFRKARSAKVVPENHWLVSLKMEFIDYDLKKGSDRKYHDLPAGQFREQFKTIICTKYGWMKDHQIAVGIPVMFNNYDTVTSHNDSRGVGNIFIFEKWNFIKETNNFPAVAIDFWYYFPSGDPDRSLGSSDSAYKISGEISKAWKDFSIHLNPCYTWSENDSPDIDELNAAILFKTFDTIWPGIEYNYTHKEGKGHSHDLLPGVIWKFAKGWSFKIAAVINLKSTLTYRDRCGLVMKVSYSW